MSHGGDARAISQGSSQSALTRVRSRYSPSLTRWTSPGGQVTGFTGQRVGAPEVRAAREALKARPRCQAQRMAA
jgi:hypothetical protein